MPTRNYFQGLQALMPIDSVDFLPTIGNLPLPCLQDAYKDLQCGVLTCIGFWFQKVLMNLGDHESQRCQRKAYM